MALLGRGPNDIVRDVLKNTFPKEGLERLFDTTILAGVEGENGDAAAGFENFGKVSEEGCKGRELVVDGDSDGLEHSSDRGLDGGVFGGADPAVGIVEGFADETT